MIDYGGFYIDRPVGNNAFSYEERAKKRIYVPKLIDARIDQVELGGPAAFIEVEDGQEKECLGMKNIYHLVDREITEMGKEVYLFDNHNHAFSGPKEGFDREGASPPACGPAQGYQDTSRL